MVKAIFGIGFLHAEKFCYKMFGFMNLSEKVDSGLLRGFNVWWGGDAVLRFRAE